MNVLALALCPLFVSGLTFWDGVGLGFDPTPSISAVGTGANGATTYVYEIFQTSTLTTHGAVVTTTSELFAATLVEDSTYEVASFVGHYASCMLESGGTAATCIDVYPTVTSTYENSVYVAIITPPTSLSSSTSGVTSSTSHSATTSRSTVPGSPQTTSFRSIIAGTIVCGLIAIAITTVFIIFYLRRRPRNASQVPPVVGDVWSIDHSTDSHQPAQPIPSHHPNPQMTSLDSRGAVGVPQGTVPVVVPYADDCLEGRQSREGVDHQHITPAAGPSSPGLSKGRHARGLQSPPVPRQSSASAPREEPDLRPEVEALRAEVEMLKAQQTMVTVPDVPPPLYDQAG